MKKIILRTILSSIMSLAAITLMAQSMGKVNELNIVLLGSLKMLKGLTVGFAIQYILYYVIAIFKADKNWHLKALKYFTDLI